MDSGVSVLNSASPAALELSHDLSFSLREERVQ